MKLSGESNTPWDVSYRKSPLVRFNEIFKNDETLERGVTYFIESIEMMNGKTYFSCEGHFFGTHCSLFYVLFSMPYENVRILSKFIRSGKIEISNSPAIDDNDVWRLSLNSTNERTHISELRQLSQEFESCIKYMAKTCRESIRHQLNEK